MIAEITALVFTLGLPDFSVSAVYRPADRAVSNWRLQAAAHIDAPAPLAVEPDMIEQGLGDWQGLSHEAFAELCRHPPHPFWPHGAEEKPPGGECFADVVERISTWK